MARRVKALEELARTMVGDGASPNMYFVSIKGNIQLVTLNAQEAYDFWRRLPRTIETALEDRKTGTICDTSPVEEGSTRLRTYDDSERWIGRALRATGGY